MLYSPNVRAITKWSQADENKMVSVYIYQTYLQTKYKLINLKLPK